MEKVHNSFVEGFKHSIPIGLGYLSVAFTFGMACVNKGMDAGIAAMISLTSLTSAGQFSALTLMMEQAPLIELAISQLIINLRYALMSLSLSQKVDRKMTTLERAVVSFGVTDEIFALASSIDGRVGTRYLLGLMVFPIFCWSFGTFLGGAASNILPSGIRDALGIAIYGMFLAIIIPPARKLHAIRVVLVLAVLLSCLFSIASAYITISPGLMIIVCSVLASAYGAYFFPIKEEGHE